jgi:predicted esterase
MSDALPRLRRRVVAAMALLLCVACTPDAAREPTPAATIAPGTGTRHLDLARGADRPLPTTLWYPVGADGTTMAAGRHPIVLFSHGLGGLPDQFAPLLSAWAAAGFVVAAPAYPHTNGRTTVRSADIGNQSADAAYVLRSLRALDTTAGDPFAGRLAVDRLAAVGFSAGATTTLGLFTRGHDRALRAAVSVAGRAPSTSFGGPAAPMLFLHGEDDPIVEIAAGRAAYRAVPWPRSFVALPGQGHGQFLNPGDPDYERICALILDFLRTHTR